MTDLTSKFDPQISRTDSNVSATELIARKNGSCSLLFNKFVALFFRARPVVKLVVESSIQPKEIDLEALTCEVRPGVAAACFKVHSCFSYDGKSLPSSIGNGFKIVCCLLTSIY